VCRSPAALPDSRRTQAFRAERATWRTVIQLNVVRSVRCILDAISAPHVAHALTAQHLQLRERLAHLLQLEQALVFQLTCDSSLEPSLLGATATSVGAPNGQLVPLTNLPLPRLKELSVYSRAGWRGAFGPAKSHARDRREHGPLVIWEDSASHRSSCASIASTISVSSSALRPDMDPESPGMVLHAYSRDIARLYRDPLVRGVLRDSQVRPEDMSGL
jgi:guanine nucleotide-binding protein alpha-1 subunit